jgi:hypothetical protein
MPVMLFDSLTSEREITGLKFAKSMTGGKDDRHETHQNGSGRT